ncbi:MAG TPA: siroheme synthase CysG [Alphaproteobacteria bacterium]|nr:siroheme synthase CysG [Alphaproteobacteria bacterium]
MDYLPIFLKVRGRRALVVGGGTVAARKVEWLRRAGARVTVVAPAVVDTLQDLARRGIVQHSARAFAAADIAGHALIVAATNDAALNRRVHLLARDAGVPVNVVDCPELCSFIVPAVIDRSPLVVAISSGGASPVLVRVLRARLETLLPRALGRLARLAGSFRHAVKHRLPDAAGRRRFWERLFAADGIERLSGVSEAEVRHDMATMLDHAAAAAVVPGEVYLVGAGPGDPELLTVRALRLIQQAEVVLHDKLVSPEILDLVRRDAERVDVGKRCGRHALSQEAINRLMVDLAKAGKNVVRLKGGDSFVFGRGGEELEFLARHGISFQVVPGVTAALGCAAYAGIPLTHRDHAQSCVFVTGHGADGVIDLDWAALAKPRQTVVIYMGLGAIAALSANLIAQGADAAMPVAAIENGTRADQRVVVSTLAKVADDVAARGLAGPALIVIGSVVRLRERLDWFSGRSAGTLVEPAPVRVGAAAE